MLFETIKSPLMALLLIFAFLGAFGTLLPLWMFINTMQLIVHLPLVSKMVPANVSHVLIGYLDIWRMNWTYLTYGMQ